MTSLEELLSLALTHDNCTTEKARIEGDCVLIPFDVFDEDRKVWTIVYERVRTVDQLLEAFGYC